MTESALGGAMSTVRDASGAWWVAQTQRHREAVARVHLAHAGFDAYVPLLRQWPRPAVGSDVGPMFPSYVFVRAEPRCLHRVGRLPGVKTLVSFGDEPACIDPRIIAFLRSREDGDGVVRAAPLAHGVTVHITDGPLRGLEAVFEQRLPGRQRVLVLLNLLQRQTRAELPETWVRFR